MTTINKQTIDTISHMNSKLDEISEQPHQTQTNQRPKTIHEVRSENRPVTSNALSRLGRPPIGIQMERRLTQQREAVAPPGVAPVEQQVAPQPQNRRLTPQQQTWAPASTPILDRFPESGNRIKEILNLIERDINFGQGMTYNLASTATKDLREELAERMKNLINSWAERTGGPLSWISEADLNNWFSQLMQEMGGFMNAGIMHYRLVYGQNLNYDTYGPRETYIGNSQYFEPISYGVASHRIQRVFTPQIRLYGATPPQRDQTPAPEPIEPTQPPAPQPQPPTPQPDERERGTPVVLTDEQFLLQYTKDPNILSESELRSLAGKTIVFTQMRNEQNFSGNISGSGLFDNIYIYQQQAQGSLPIANSGRAFNILRSVLNIGDYINPLNLIFGQPVPPFVWLGPESRNNDYASGIADLVSFYHDCLYAGQGSGAGANSRAADLISMKIARVCQYYLDAKNNSRIPIMTLKTELGPEKKDLFITNQSSASNDSGWLGRFIFAFQLINNTIGTEENLQEIRFTAQDFLNDTFHGRQQKLRILWIYSTGLNNNLYSLNTVVPDPNYSSFLINASTINAQLMETDLLSDTTWPNIRDSLNIAAGQIQQWRNENTRPTTEELDQNLIVRLQYFGIIRELMEQAAQCIQIYYLNKELKPPTVYSIVPSEPFDKSKEPPLEKLDEKINIDDTIIPSVLNMDDNSKLIYILRHLVIEGAVAY